MATPHDDALQLAQRRLEERRAQQGIAPRREGAADRIQREERSRPSNATAPRVIALPGAAPSARSRPTVANEAEESADDWPELIPPGVYQVVLVTAEKKRNLWSRTRVKWLMRWRVIDQGDAFGVELPMFANGILKADRLHPARKFVELYAIGTGLRPPRGLWRIPPARFLGDCVFEARVATTSTNARQIERPAALHYSVVSDLIRRESGTPPVLRREPS